MSTSRWKMTFGARAACINFAEDPEKWMEDDCRVERPSDEWGGDCGRWEIAAVKKKDFSIPS